MSTKPGITSPKPLLVLLLAVSITWGGLNGQANAQEPIPTEPPENRVEYDEKTAQSIDGMLMCPVCPAESIDQAQVPIAKQMRRLVREKLAQGESRDQILEYFAGVYGPDILAAPSKTGFNLVAWTLPVVGVLGALAAGFFVLRSMSARAGQEGAGLPGSENDLAPYLQAVDRDLGIIEGIESRDPRETEAKADPNG